MFRGEISYTKNKGYKMKIPDKQKLEMLYIRLETVENIHGAHDAGIDGYEELLIKTYKNQIRYLKRKLKNQGGSMKVNEDELRSLIMRLQLNLKRYGLRKQSADITEFLMDNFTITCKDFKKVSEKIIGYGREKIAQ